MQRNGTSTSVVNLFFSAAAAARLGLGCVPRLGLGSSARPWLLFKRAPSRALHTEREEFRADFLGQSPVSPRPEVGDAANHRVPPGGDLRSWGPLVNGKKRGKGC